MFTASTRLLRWPALGSALDSQFGPTLLFGSGGQLVEVYKDTALGLPPLNTTLARRMMENTQIVEALKGVRGRRAIDLDALAYHVAVIEAQVHGFVEAVGFEQLQRHAIGQAAVAHDADQRFAVARHALDGGA